MHWRDQLEAAGAVSFYRENMGSEERPCIMPFIHGFNADGLEVGLYNLISSKIDIFDQPREWNKAFKVGLFKYE